MRGLCAHPHSPPNLRWEYSLWTWIVFQNNGPKIIKCHIDNDAAQLFEKNQKKWFSIYKSNTVSSMCQRKCFFLCYCCCCCCCISKYVRSGNFEVQFESLTFILIIIVVIIVPVIINRTRANSNSKTHFFCLPKIIFLIDSVNFLIWNLFRTSRKNQ